jgi:hypothetical protein
VNRSITRSGLWVDCDDKSERIHTSTPISSCLLTSDGKKNRSPDDRAASKLLGNADMISEAFMNRELHINRPSMTDKS